MPAAGAVCHGSCSKLAISCESWRRKRLTTGGVVRENKHLAPGLRVLRPERGAGETSRVLLPAALPGTEPSAGQSPPGLAPNFPPPLGGAARCWGGPARGRGRSVSIAAPQHPRHPRHRRGEERSAAQRGSPVLPRAGWAPRPPSEQPEGPGAASHRPHPLLLLRSPPAFSVIFYLFFFSPFPARGRHRPACRSPTCWSYGKASRWSPWRRR